MKKIFTTLSFGLLVGAMSAQVIFSSDLSSWEGSLPTDFMGTKSNVGAANVTEITAGSVYGTSNAQLKNTASGHKRFTTQPIAVEDGQGYEVKFWAKGQGDIRVGLYDNRAGDGGGYAPYGNYISLNSTSVSEYSYVVSAANSIADGEFIFSIRNTVEPTHIEIDSVSIELVTVEPPAPVSIYDIQFTTDASGDSPLKDQVVLTGGIVTATRTDGKFWIQNGTGPWTGVYVFHAPTTPVELGDSVVFSATVQEYNGLTELSFVSDFEVVSSGNFFMATNVSSAQANSEAYEGCLVRVSNANCTAAPDQFNEWTINDGSGPAKVDDFLYAYTPTVGQAYNVTGIVEYYQNFKILPRGANDISTASVTSVGELNKTSVSMYPVPATNVLTIQIDSATPQEVSVTDSYGKQIERFISGGVSHLNVEEYASGIYFLHINGATHRFVKQ